MLYEHWSCMKRRVSTSCLNQCPYYWEGLHLGSNVRDCEETVAEDGNVKLQKDVIFILFAETASKSGYCIAVLCEVHQGFPEGGELSPV